MPGGRAAFERELIKTRIGKGRRRARAQGKSLDLTFKFIEHQKAEAIICREHGEEAFGKSCRNYNVTGQWLRNFSL
jgi:DNA invertase Pin-like site-specific DNA recombinase